MHAEKDDNPGEFGSPNPEKKKYFRLPPGGDFGILSPDLLDFNPKNLRLSASNFY